MIYSFISSILLLSAFPKLNLFAFAWCAFVPLLMYALQEPNRKKVLFASFVMGFIFYCGIFYWFVPMFCASGMNVLLPGPQWVGKTFGILSLVGNVAMGCVLVSLLSAYLSAYIVLWAYCVHTMRERYATVWFVLTVSCLWVTCELVRSYAFTGFPWALLGYSQWNNTTMIQIAEYTGVYGVSFVVMFFNAALATIIVYFHQHKKYLWSNSVAVVCLLSVVFLFGYHTLHRREMPPKTITCSLLQGNIDQYKKFDEAYHEYIKTEYAALITPNDTQLFIWPETALPSVYPFDPATNTWLREHIVRSKAQHIIGTFLEDQGVFLNSAVLFDARGNAQARYSKKHLVPFGEVFPLKHVLEKIIPLIRSMETMHPGTQSGMFVVRDIPVGITICFEMLFPNEVRMLAQDGAAMLVNVSNDAWYLRTSAPVQLFSHSVFRAIENRRSVARAANTGISAFIDEHGRVVSSLGVFKTGVITYAVPLNNRLTWYTRYGDVFAYFCSVIGIVGWAMKRRKKVESGK